MVCVVDGRIDTQALAASLGIDPSLPPARHVATGFERLGRGVLERLRGEFALVVWDRERRAGLLARDRLSVRPLFLAERGAALLFASEVRNLLALLPTRPPPDSVAMAHWLARTGAPDGRTLFEGIRSLPGGCAVVVADGRWHRERFWHTRPRTPLPVDAAEAAHEVRTGLAAAVGRALDGAVRPGVMLSGGLDSAAVAAHAAAATPVAYSGVFPSHPEVDESAEVRRVREHLGLRGVEQVFAGGSALAAAIEFQEAWELPTVTPNGFVWRPLLDRAVDDGVDAMLDGEGGDELFGFARYLIADRLLGARPLAALRLARRVPGMGDRPRPVWIRRALVSYGLRGALPHGLHEALRAARGHRDRPDWILADVALDRLEWKRRRGPRWWAHQVDMLEADRLGAADEDRRQSMLRGVRARHPLRDPRLIDLMLGLPPELGFDPHLDRPLFRRALAGLLPPQTLADTHKPFFNALAREAFAGPDLPGLRLLVAEAPPELAALVRPGAAAELVERAVGGGPPGSDLDLWRVATLALWLRRQADPAGDPLPHVA